MSSGRVRSGSYGDRCFRFASRPDELAIPTTGDAEACPVLGSAVSGGCARGYGARTVISCRVEPLCRSEKIAGQRRDGRAEYTVRTVDIPWLELLGVEIEKISGRSSISWDTLGLDAGMTVGRSGGRKRASWWVPEHVFREALALKRDRRRERARRRERMEVRWVRTG